MNSNIKEEASIEIEEVVSEPAFIIVQKSENYIN